MSEDGEGILEAILEHALNKASDENDYSERLVGPPSTSGDGDTKPAKSDNETHSQWAIGGNGRFMPVGQTIPKLEAGIYEPFAVPGMWGLERLSITSDGIYTLPDMATEVVLKEIKKFWNSEAKYRAHNLLYKRGIILFGEPGGGKTVCVKLLMNELVKQDGIVINVTNVQLAITCVKAVRRVEPKRNLIMVFEDIDEIIAYQGESNILSLLDGESNTDNVVHLATTNHPEKLGARIINRPSRFDNRVYIGMPSALARKVYLEKATNNGIDEAVLAKWVTDTDKMSIAHLRELVAAVYCLEQPYENVIGRLQKMTEPVAINDGFKTKKGMGFKDSMRSD